MKNILIVLIALVCFPVFGQDTIDYWFGKYYYEKENIEIPSLQYELVQPEIYKDKKEKFIKRLKIKEGSYGMVQVVDLPFLKKAKKIAKNKEDDIYLLHVKGVNMEKASITVYLNLPNGVYIETFTPEGIPIQKIDSRYNTELSIYNILGTELFSNKNELIVKVTVPKRNKDDIVIKISGLYYYENVQSDEGNNKKAKALSKSDLKVMQTNQAAVGNCDNYITCMDGHEAWKNEYSGLFEIHYIIREKVGGVIVNTYNVYATGFLLNTSSNYNLNKSTPAYALTCFHPLEEAVSAGYTVESILVDPNSTYIHFKHFRDECSGVAHNYHIWEPPCFTVKEKGAWLTKTDYDEDYLFLQFGNNSTIANNEVNYGVKAYLGWRNDLLTAYDYEFSGPTRTFHHTRENLANGIVSNELRFSIDDGYAYPNGDLITLNNDLGVSNTGASGSPIFDKDHFVIGMNLSGRNTCADPKLQGNTGLAFSKLWTKANLSTYLENSTSVNSFNINWEDLPGHCSDCEYTFAKGETGLDCGGPCKPCKSIFGEVNVEFNNYTTQPYYVHATNEVAFTGSASKPLFIEESATIFAKNKIVINRNVEFRKGIAVAMSTTADPIVVFNEPDVLCGFGYTNGLIWGDMLKVNMKNANSYEILIKNSAGKIVYEGSGNVRFDGWINVWDTNIGSNVNRAFIC